MRFTTPAVFLALMTAPWLPSGHTQAPAPAGQVVFEKVATVGMQAPDTQLTLDSIQPFYYFLDGGTVVFWANTKRPWRFGLYSAKDGQIKTIAMAHAEGAKTTSLYGEGIPEEFYFASPMLATGVMEFVDVKPGGSLLYLTLRFGILSKTRSVAVWDGDKLRPVLWRGESPAWLGGEKIQAAEVVSINPDGSAMIVYSTEGGQFGLASHSKASGLRPLLSTNSALPGMPGVTIIPATFESLFERRLGRHWRWRLAPPQILDGRLFLLVEPSAGHPFVARIADGKTEKILEAQTADPTDSGFTADEIWSFKAVTPDVVAVVIDGGKAGRRLLVSDNGKVSRIYQSTGAYEEVAARLGFKDATGIEELGALQMLSVETKSFCALAAEAHSLRIYATQVRCFDGTKMNNVTGSARIGVVGEGNFMRAIPGMPGVLVIDANYIAAARNAVPVKSQWMARGDAAGQDLRPVPEIYSSGNTKYTLGDVVAVDPVRKTPWLRLADGLYKVRVAGN